MAERWVSNARNRLLLRLIDAVAALSPARHRRKGPALAAGDVRRILVIELWNIGDVVLTLPFLTRLRAVFPLAKVTMLARPHAQEILRGTHLVDDFIEADLVWSGGAAGFAPSKLLELSRVVREIRRRHFDIIFKGRMHVREHIILGLSGATRTLAHSLGAGDALLTDPLTRTDPDQHKTQDWLGLLAPFGGGSDASYLRLHISDGERDWANRFLAERGISASDRLVGLHCGASVERKRWPLERFAEVAGILTQRPETRVIAFVDEQGYGSELAAVPGVVVAKVSLREMMALIERCAVLVCNDSGPMHIAGALGVPVVAVFGSGIPRWFAPLGDGHQLLEGSSSLGDLTVRGGGVKVVAVADVLAAVEKAMARC